MSTLKSTPKKLGVIALCLVGVIPLLWLIFYLVFYIGYGNLKVWGHQDFAKYGISQIQPAAEMEELFDDCRHYIVYEGQESVSTWNTTVYFGDRYKLILRVPVEIESKNLGHMIGEPVFHLWEVKSVDVSATGQVGTRYNKSGSITFDLIQWEKIYESGGDFSTIGYTIDTTPVPNFQAAADAARPSN